MNFSLSSRVLLAFISFLSVGWLGIAKAADKSSKADTRVPPVTYRSVFRETSLGIEQDKVEWRKANDDVGKFTRGHVDILKQEEMDGKAMLPKAAPATRATPHKH